MSAKHLKLSAILYNQYLQQQVVFAVVFLARLQQQQTAKTLERQTRARSARTRGLFDAVEKYRRAILEDLVCAENSCTSATQTRVYFVSDVIDFEWLGRIGSHGILQRTVEDFFTLD